MVIHAPERSRLQKGQTTAHHPGCLPTTIPSTAGADRAWAPPAHLSHGIKHMAASLLQGI